MSGIEGPSITKICIVGEIDTGKTSLHRYFVKRQFKRNYHPTIGSDFSFIEKRSRNNKVYRLAIWDLSGNEKYRQSHSTYYQGMAGLILVFDLTRIETLKATLTWLNAIEKIVTLKFPILLVGTKKDISSISTHSVSDNDVRNLIIQFQEANQNGVVITFFKTSAKTGENVDEVFHHLIETLDYQSSKQKIKTQP